MREKKWLVYRATSPSGKFYIGITSCGLRRRRESHVDHARRGKKPGYFQRALRKYGNDMRWESLDQDLDRTIAQVAETFYIMMHRSNESQFGYNGTSGGEAPIYNQRTIAKMRDSALKRPVSEACRSAVRRALVREDGVEFKSIREAACVLGVTNSAIQAALRLGTRSGGYRFRYKDEAQVQPRGVKPFSYSARARSQMRCSKSVIRSDGVVYRTLSAAAKELRVHSSSICYSLKKGGVCKGFRFRYSEEDFVIPLSRPKGRPKGIPSGQRHLATTKRRLAALVITHVEKTP